MRWEARGTKGHPEQLDLPAHRVLLESQQHLLQLQEHPLVHQARQVRAFDLRFTDGKVRSDLSTDVVVCFLAAFSDKRCTIYLNIVISFKGGKRLR